MGLETGTYISDLNASNPAATDPKSQGDDHIRLIKATVKATFPNVAGAVTPTHTELNYVDGVTSAIQTQIDSKGAIAGQAWTGNHTFPTQSPGDNSTLAATTAYVDAADALKADLDSPALTGTPTSPTASPGTNTTQLATTAFVVQQAFQTALPVQTGEGGKYLRTDGVAASWQSLASSKNAQSGNYALLLGDANKHLVLTSTATLSLMAAATAGDGFLFYVRNDGTGIWTIDGDGSETIDGLTSIKVYTGESFAVVCDGAAWRTIGRSRGPVRIASATVSVAAASIDFEAGFDDPEFTRFRVRYRDLSCSASATPRVRVKKSGAYQSSGYAGETGVAGSASSDAFDLTTLSGGAYSAASVFSGRVEIDSPGATAAYNQVLSAVFSDTSASGGSSSGNTGSQSTAAAIEGIRFLFNTGDIDAGTIIFEGER